MTCVVGMISRGQVMIGADSAGLSGWHLTVRADPKVFESKGFLYGFSGSFRLGQILRYAFTPPEIGEVVDLLAYMVSKFVPALRAVIAAEVSSKAQSDAPGDFLVGIRGRLFEVCTDFQVGENVDGIAAIGCGREPALGALHALKRACPDLPGREALDVALSAAERWNGGVRRPFAIVAGEL